ncbi:glycosyltransferase family 2 protein [Jejubacter calystegiae]|uniref:Glycosyltransferase family 2 protein n=1 Tax=Jejubacter calystegiae TaxID=2579935 RepID=A0A4P8YMG2_9ENTR|nr:glycosyltransferase family 2 protein [Jejubacter calystegiae]QCT22031.1 glycosyltransferase family 2 protein [Jejubacter calystegiae]
MDADLHKIKVDVVLACYNGEKFIAEQIDSILNQSHKNISLIITDDGSSDKTSNIIELYQQTDNRVIVISKERAGGVIQNFERGLSASSSDYIMLSDQDDIWHTDKIKICLEKAVKEECGKENGPLLIYSDLCLVNERLDVISTSFYQYSGLNPERNLHIENLSWMGSVMGCTILMNRAALNLVLPFRYPLVMHDHWLAFKTLESGRIFYLDKPLVYYRQHSENVSGGLGGNKNIFKRMLDVNRYRQMTKRVDAVRSMNNVDSFTKKMFFLKTIIKSIPRCETIKYPVLFLLLFMFSKRKF